MTKNQFFTALLESDLINPIDQTESIQDFFHSRTEGFSVSKVSKEYREIEKLKAFYEEGFKISSRTRTLEKLKVNSYLDKCVEAETISNFLHFRQGFREGIKFIIQMIVTDEYKKIA